MVILIIKKVLDYVFKTVTFSVVGIYYIVKLMYSYFYFRGNIMATEIIKRLSTRTTEAEQMIQLLKKQIELIKVAQGSSNGSSIDQEIQLLRRENSQLKAQVSDWKNKLNAAENANGVKQVTVTSVPPSTPSSDEIKKSSPEKEMPAKKEKPKKEKKEDTKPATSDGGGNDVHVGR